jgi:glycosyltransferase involved in cell wall biosynthesis
MSDIAGNTRTSKAAPGSRAEPAAPVAPLVVDTRPMRIAQVAPLGEAVPPALYGGTERVIGWLTDELVSRGHDVTLFATGDSRTAASLEAVWPSSLRSAPLIDTGAPHALLLERVFRRAAEFDVLHFHIGYETFPLFTRQPVPFLTTLHGPLDCLEHRLVFEAFPDVPIVAISEAQRRAQPRAGWAATIHHGLPEDLLMPRDRRREYLAFLGRLSPEKAPDRAIRIAERSGLKIRIAAKIDPADRDYFAAIIRPLLRLSHVEYVGEIEDAAKADFLSGALALLMPIDWPEPFGLTIIEAMACGTPVVAFNRGSVSELVECGVTGFVVDDEAEAVAAVRQLGGLSSARIRARFEGRFTARRMTGDYLEVYRRLPMGARAPD